MFSFPTHQDQLSAHMPRPNAEVPGLRAGAISAASSVYEDRSSDDFVWATLQRPSTAGSAHSERDGPQIQRIKKSLFNSNIPILRRARSNLGKSSDPSGTQEPRQGGFLNVPNGISGNKLAHAEQSPSNDSFSSSPNNSKFGLQVSITAGNSKPKKSSFAEKAAKFGREAFNPETRPIWRSASGRSPSVEPPARPTPTQQSSSYTIVRTPSRNLFPDERGTSTHETKQTQSKQVSSDIQPYDETIQPTPPLKISKQRPRTPTRQDAENSSVQGSYDFFPAPVAANSRALSRSSNASSQIVRKPLASQVTDHENIPPNQSPEMDGNYSPGHEIVQASHSPDMNNHNSPLSGREVNEPRSHFSWTTYAESVVDEDDRPSPENQQRGPQRGPTSHFSWSTVNTNTTYQTESPSSSPPSYAGDRLASAMMARRRPVPSHDTPLSNPVGRRYVSAAQAPTYETPLSNPVGRRHVSAAQAPTYDTSLSTSVRRRQLSEAQVQTSAKPRNLDTAVHPALKKSKESIESEKTSVSPVEKALPLPPDMSRGGSPIEVLTAQRDDLGVQHANLQRVITELQKLDRASPLEVDEKSRRKNRQKLEEFIEKLEEVQREEHTVGMALARAVRRADRAEGGEGSGLWLRRVTG
ncbi:hypothetical protein MBLNU459_g7210t2 [Dothideomycetes sp. NU459]